jgi:hypothetical protein
LLCARKSIDGNYQGDSKTIRLKIRGGDLASRRYKEFVDKAVRFSSCWLQWKTSIAFIKDEEKEFEGLESPEACAGGTILNKWGISMRSARKDQQEDDGANRNLSVLGPHEEE